MTLHFGERFDSQDVELDGQDFDACTFVNCTLVYRGGDPPRLPNNMFVSCQFELRDAALRTLAFFRELYVCGGADWVDMWFSLCQGPELPSSPEGAQQ